MSWPREALEALRRMVLIDERIKTLTDAMKELATTTKDIDTRPNRLEAKFALLERMASPARKSLLEKRRK